MRTLSIITVNLDNCSGLMKTMESVIHQAFKDIEYIVIDGGSIDGSRELIENYSGKIDYWVSEKDDGVYDAMNKGISKSTGIYCLFLNSGDFLAGSDILEKVFSFRFKEDILYGELVFDYGKTNYHIGKLPEVITLPYLFEYNMWHPASFIKRSLFNESGCYNKNYTFAADYDFFFKSIIIHKASTRYLPFPISVYDTNGKSSNPKNFNIIMKERNEIHASHLSKEQIEQLSLKKKPENNTILKRHFPYSHFYALVKKIYRVCKKAVKALLNLNKSKKITFFTPYMGCTGSEIALLNLLNNIHPDFKCHVTSKYKGELSHSLIPSISYSYFFNSNDNTLEVKITNWIRRKLLLPASLFMRKNSVWYINTIVLPELLEYAQKKSIKTILHIHELEHIFAKLSKDEIQRIIEYPDLIIANSQITAALLSSLGRSRGVEICYPSINTSKSVKNCEVYERYRSKLGINKSTYVWSMSGTLDPNKNPFLFIDTASEVIKTHTDVKFIWIGAVTDHGYKELCINRAEQSGIADRILWITPDRNDYYNYFNCADGFILTSIQESFSLVTLEALLFELPIVAHNCGGVREILMDDIGVIVNELNDPVKMAIPMRHYMDGSLSVDRLKMKARSAYFDISIWSAKWNTILDDYKNRPPGSSRFFSGKG